MTAAVVIISCNKSFVHLPSPLGDAEGSMGPVLLCWGLERVMCKLLNGKGSLSYFYVYLRGEKNLKLLLPVSKFS